MLLISPQADNSLKLLFLVTAGKGKAVVPQCRREILQLKQLLDVKHVGLPLFRSQSVWDSLARCNLLARKRISQGFIASWRGWHREEKGVSAVCLSTLAHCRMAAVNPVTMVLVYFLVKTLLPHRMTRYVEGAGFNIGFFLFALLLTITLW